MLKLKHKKVYENFIQRYKFYIESHQKLELVVALAWSQARTKHFKWFIQLKARDPSQSSELELELPKDSVSPDPVVVYP